MEAFVCAHMIDNIWVSDFCKSDDLPKLDVVHISNILFTCRFERPWLNTLEKLSALKIAWFQYDFEEHEFDHDEQGMFVLKASFVERPAHNIPKTNSRAKY